MVSGTALEKSNLSLPSDSGRREAERRHKTSLLLGTAICRYWPCASLSATQRSGRYRMQSGPSVAIAIRSLLTHLRHSCQIGGVLCKNDFRAAFLKLSNRTGQLAPLSLQDVLHVTVFPLRHDLHTF